jgi:cupin 2 domain-containing protein
MSDTERADGNLFTEIPDALGQEQHRVLRAGDHTRVTRIVSPPGYADAPDSWYDQDWDEWVLVLSGSAGLRFARETAPRVLKAGDYMSIPAHVRHRVEWTDAEHPTIWLAVHHR